MAFNIFNLFTRTRLNFRVRNLTLWTNIRKPTLRYESNNQEHTINFIRTISMSKIKEKGDKVVITIAFKNQKYPLTAKVGDSLLDVVKNSNLDIPSYGACDGTLACSTCHVICNPDDLKRLESATAEEKDMLELTEGIQDTSRLGCQIQLTKDMDGIEFKIPDVIVDVRGQE